VPVTASGATASATAAGRARSPSTRPSRPLCLRGATVTGFAISHAHVAELAEAARALNARLAAGALTVRVTHVLPPEEAATAHRLGEQATRGRVVLRVRDATPSLSIWSPS
jgi:NADPH:quinone reductase-like Zn-dependent oxidoreductase